MLLKSVGILIVEQVREPIGIFWSLVAPIAYIVLVAKVPDGLYLSVDLYITTAAWSLSYIALIGACNGFGLYLVGRRESGFVRSFLSNSSRRRKFILAQYLASVALTLMFGAALIAITGFALADIGIAQVATLFMKYVLIVATFTFAATLFAALPLTFQSVSSVISVTLTIIIVAGLATQSAAGAAHPWATYLNPFATSAYFIAASTPSHAMLSTLAAQLVLLGLLGVYGLSRFRVNPEWSNR